MKNIYKYLIIALITVLCSCSENERLLFDSDIAGLSFEPIGFTVNANKKDSILVNFKFKKPTVQKYVVKIRVRALGVQKDYDRSFSFELDDDITAIEGVHFEKLEDEYIMPKNKSYAIVPITLLRDPSLEDDIVHFTLKLKTNEYFGEGIKDYKTLKIKFFDNLKEPPVYWAFFKRHFRAYNYDPIIMAKIMEIGEIESETWAAENYSVYKLIADATKKWFNDNPTVGSNGKVIKFNIY